MELIGAFWQILVVLGGIAAAAFYVTSSIQRQRHEELAALADTRGQRIDDLESEIKDLRAEVKELKGQMNALQGLKATEIASEVVAQIAPLITGLD